MLQQLIAGCWMAFQSSWARNGNVFPAEIRRKNHVKINICENPKILTFDIVVRVYTELDFYKARCRPDNIVCLLFTILSSRR